MMVTPYVGVWIETWQKYWDAMNSKSHPTWVCGLKQRYQDSEQHHQYVTPYVGVWIETSSSRCISECIDVTPYVGVWIETIRPVSAESDQ